MVGTTASTAGPPAPSHTRSLGKAYLDAGSEQEGHRELTYSLGSVDPGRHLRPLGAVGVVPAHRVGTRRRTRSCRQPRVDTATGAGGHLPRRVLLAGGARNRRVGGVGAARLEPPALRDHRGAR